MFNRKVVPKYQRMLESELEIVVRTLRTRTAGTEEYKAIVNEIIRLNEILYKPVPRISPETRATIAGNLLGILMILKHEHVNVITSKALSFVIRPR